MSSSTLLGDRRWTSSRKGMTVLGKVPKPINLPSQRLENHGLDPNVEIVPKGTLTWGSRPSAPTSAWASSSPSPSSADGSIGSPNRQNGRPSSGGTGTRPSTAGSDRCSEPAANSWTSSSRPSSASGILASSQAPLAATRPRSAETRPGSSQLSRFAEPIPENSVPWNAGSAGHLGSTSKTSNFMLSSGDFPTLGSAKNSEIVNDQQGTHGQDSHGHSLSSGLASGEKERFDSTRGMTMKVQLERDNSNAWKVDTHSQNTPSSNTKSWHADPSNKLSPGTSMQPQHYNWHGPPQSRSDGIWYRGVPPGPYGSGDGPPGSYMSDPFAYYSSQQVPRPTNNNNSSPQSGALLGGYPHKRDESFHPSATSDPYMIPAISVVPVRPEMYCSPVPCDGYHVPPHAGLSGSSERERPVIGMAAGPGIYDQFSSQNVAGDRGKAGSCTVSPTPLYGQQLEGSHCRDSHGEKYRVLLKHHEEFADNGIRSNKGHLNAISPNASMKKDPSVLQEEWETDGIGVEPTKTTQGAVCLAAPCNNSSTAPTQVSCSKGMPGQDKVQRGCDHQVKNSEPVIPQSNVQHILKKSTLIEKIEGLNNKVRVTERHSEAAVSSKEERPRSVKSENVTVGNSAKTMQSRPSSTSKDPSENVHIDPKSMLLDDQEIALKKRSSGYAGKVKVVSQESAITTATVTGNSGIHPNIQAEQVRGHASHGSDRYSKSRINESEVRRLPVPRRESLDINLMANADKASDVDPQSEVADPSKKHYVNKVREETPPVDPTEYDAQREKMKEMAAQRAKQLQKEEEERRREQKAKALAKLEELDRRTVASTAAWTINHTCVQSNALSPKQDAIVSNVQNVDAIGRASIETVASGSISVVNDSILHSVGDSLVQNKKSTGSVVQPQVSVKNSEGAIITQKVGFASSSQISFGTVQATHSSMKKVCGLPEVQKCASAIDQPKVTDVAYLDSQTSQFILENTQESYISGKVGNEMSQKSIDCPPGDSAKHRQVGHRRRNTIPREKNSTGTLAPPDSAGPHSPRVLTAGNASSGGDVVHNSVEVSGPLVQHKKKGNRAIKPKSRPQLGASSSMEDSQGRREGILEKPPEYCNIEENSQIESASSALRQTGEDNTGGRDSSEDIAQANSGWLELGDEVQGKTIGQWKPHTPRRPMRNGHSKSSDKSRGSEVVWTPVRLPSKGQPCEEQICQDQDPTFKSETDSQNVKCKRADIERYVPKVVAKDASQQRNLQKTLPCVVNTKTENLSIEVESGKNTCKEDAQMPKSDIAVGNKSTEINRPSKHGKGGHASWRQRSLPEGFSDAVKPISKLPYQNFQSNTGSSPIRSSYHMNDGNDPCNSNPNEHAVSNVKDQIMGSRGKQRQVRRMQKTSEENPPMMDSKIAPSGASENPESVTLDASDGNGKGLFRADTVQVERTRPHWKPKSNQTSASVTKHQEGSYHEKSHNAKLVKESEDKHAMHQGADSMENGSFEEHDLSSDALAGLVEQNSGKPDPKLGLHRQGRNDGQSRKGQDGGRLHRGQEANYGGHQDNGYWNGAVSGDRRRQSYHYEYQRVGSHNKSNDPHVDAPTDSSQHGNTRPARPRYRERGHARRGGQFYARNGGDGETQ